MQLCNEAKGEDRARSLKISCVVFLAPGTCNSTFYGSQLQQVDAKGKAMAGIWKWLGGKRKVVFNAKYLLSKSTGQNLMRNGKASRSNLIMWEGRRKRVFGAFNHKDDSETIPRVKSLAWNCKA